MRYRARVIRPGGGVGTVELIAADADDAAARLAADGLGVLSLARARALRGEAAFALTQFAQELRALLEAGIALLEAVETLAEKEPRAAARQVLGAVAAALGEGRTLSTALEGRPEAFPPLFVATVRASERTGDLAEALGRYVAYRQQQEAVRARLVNAAIYPVLLLVVGGLVVLFLLAYVVPRFARVYADIGGDLPLASQWLLAAGTALAENGAAFAVLGALGAVALVALFRSRAAAAWAGMLLWRVPFVAARLLAYQMARFFRTCGMLVGGGVPVVRALAMSEGLLQAHLRPALAAAVRQVREGRALSDALDASGLATPVILRMLRVGEKTGELGAMMERIAQFHDAEAERAAEWLTRLASPVLMLAMGLVIGAVVVLMYLPIFQLAEQVR
ncbi:MAG: type II secretion system F family protein [Burkholderiales bacterium]|nr:type II secretion system F family protein [Burkholderiales bacterium]